MKDISFTQFVEYLNPIIDYEKDYKVQADALRDMFPSSYVFPELGVKFRESYIKLLEEYLDISSNWLEYFFYECDQGNYPMEVFFEKNGKEYTFEMDSLETLYLFLTDNLDFGDDLEKSGDE